MLDPRLKVKLMHFKNVNVKDPSDSFMTWLGTVRLPKANYLTKAIRGKLLVEIPSDAVRYMAYKCNGCNDLLKKQALYLDFINLWENRVELEIEEYEFDELVEEYLKKGK